MRKVTRINRGIRIESLEARDLMSATIAGASGLELTSLQTNHLNNESSRLASHTGLFANSQALPSAKWDTQGSTTFSDTFNVGVIASATGGIAEVDFQVNGGDWHQVTQMSKNPQTGATEYWITLNANDFANGQIKVQAAVMPNVGQVLYLSPLTLTVDKSATTGSHNTTTGSTDDGGNGDSGSGDSGNGDSGNGDSGSGDSGNGDSGNTGSTQITGTSGTNADAIATANWDAVPHETFSGQFNVGVVAFHASGIASVEFRVNGGDWQTVTQMAVNPQTGANEYFITLNAADYSDGQITIEAVATPVTGQAKTLTPLVLYTNAGGTLQSNTVYVSNSGSDSNTGDQADPYATLQQALAAVGDGGTVIIENAGTYDLGVIPNTQTVNQTNQRWITIEAATGLAQNQVTLITPDDNRMITRVNYLKFEGVSFDLSHIQGSIYGNNIWFDNDTLTMSNMNNPNCALPVRGWGGANDYYTNCLATHVVYGFVDAQLARNCEVSDITGDAYQNSQTVIDCDVHDFYGTLTHHADVYQMWGSLDNVILYGFSAWNVEGADMFFLQPNYKPGVGPFTMSNTAFVNINFQSDDAASGIERRFSQLQNSLTNILFQNVTMGNEGILLRSDVHTNDDRTWDASEVVFEDCTFSPGQSLNPNASGVQFINCTNGTPSIPMWQPEQWLVSAAA